MAMTAWSKPREISGGTKIRDADNLIEDNGIDLQHYINGTNGPLNNYTGQGIQAEITNQVTSIVQEYTYSYNSSTKTLIISS